MKKEMSLGDVVLATVGAIVIGKIVKQKVLRSLQGVEIQATYTANSKKPFTVKVKNA